jgi:hypothetical protein
MISLVGETFQWPLLQTVYQNSLREGETYQDYISYDPSRENNKGLASLMKEMEAKRADSASSGGGGGRGMNMGNLFGSGLGGGGGGLGGLGGLGGGLGGLGGMGDLGSLLDSMGGLGKLEGEISNFFAGANSVNNMTSSERKMELLSNALDLLQSMRDSSFFFF